MITPYEVEFGQRVHDLFLLAASVAALTDKQVWLIRNVPVEDLVLALTSRKEVT